MECLSLPTPTPHLAGWACKTIPAKPSSLVRTVCCCHPAAAADGHIRLEIEIPQWAPGHLPSAATHLGDPPVRLVGGASLRRAGDGRKPGARQSAWEVQGGRAGVPWGTTPLVRAWSWLSGSPLSAAACKGMQGGFLCHL